MAIHHALGLGDLSPGTAKKEAELIASRWQPWRSYAVIRAWAQPLVPQPRKESADQGQHTHGGAAWKSFARALWAEHELRQGGT